MGIQKKLTTKKKWQEQKPPQENPTSESKDPEKNLSPRPPKSPPQPCEESRNPTDSDPEQSLSEKSENTKDLLIYSSENYPSKDWSRILLMRNPLSSDSRELPCWPYKKLSKL